MSFLFTDSFDMCTSLAQKWDIWNYTIDDAGFSITNVGRNSSNGLKATRNQFIGKTFPARKTTVIAGFAWRPSAPITGGPWSIAQFLDQQNVQVSLAVDSNHRFIAYRGDQATLLAQTGNNQFDTVSWHYYELKVVFDNSGGIFLLKRDGASILLSLDNIDTSQTNNAYATAFGLGRISSAAGLPGYFSWDDVYVIDNVGSPDDFLGEVLSIEYRAPNAPGDSTQFTPSAGANWQCVDEVPADTVDKVSSTVHGNKDLFPIAALSSVIGRVACANVWAYVGKTGTQTGRLKFVQKKSSEAEGSSQIVGAGPHYLNHPFVAAPGGGALTIPGINASQFGMIDSET